MPPKKQRQAPASEPPASAPAAAAAADPPPRRVSHRVAGFPAMDLDDRRAGGPVLLRSEVDRLFWDQWDTEILWTWIKDFNRKEIAMTAALKADREALLTILVESDWVRRPVEGKELAQFLLVWKKITGAHKSDPRPGLFDPRPAASSREAMAPAPAPVLSTPAPKAPAVSSKRKVAASYFDEDDEDDGDGAARGRAAEEPASKDGATRCIADELMTPSLHLSQPFKCCPHCGCRNSGETDLSFCCCMCGLYAGIPLESPVNQMKLIGGPGSKAPAAAAASSSSSVIPSGQSLSDILFEGSTATQRREKELKEYLKLPHNPIFDEMPAGAQFPYTAALDIGREAFNASAYEVPSPTLLQAIRAGVLIKPGFAKPRLISEAMERGPGIAVGGGVLTAPTTAIPRLESADEFCMAMFSTILPALIDRPKALAEWLSLGRTALELHAQKRSWPIAVGYIDQLLAERTYARKPYAQVSVGVMTSVVFSVPLPSFPIGARGPQQQQQQHQRISFCGDYNFKATGCARGAACTYKHECQYGSLGCRDTRAHKSIDCPLKPVRNNDQRRKGQGDGESVKSAPPSGAAKPKGKD